MRMLSPVFLLGTLILVNGQEQSFGMIIKTFVTLSSISTIDERFVNSFPPSIMENAERINELELLKLGKDNNSTKKLFKKLKQTKFCDNKRVVNLIEIPQLIGNLIVNLICFLLINM